MITNGLRWAVSAREWHGGRVARRRQPDPLTTARRIVGGGAFLILLTACTTGSENAPTRPARPAAVPSTSAPAQSSPGDSTVSPSAAAPGPTDEAVRFRSAAALSTVRRIVDAGPREATSRAYRVASRLVERELVGLGYEVARQRFPVPRGESWGVPVPAGRTWNVVAHRPGFDPTAPHLVVGAHLDTVPQAPGGVDNASGVAVLVELARLGAAAPPRLPVVFVAFGAEEPRGPGDHEHHFGSQVYVRRLADPDAVQGMVSLDRVGVGSRVLACTGGLSPSRVQRELLAAADAVGIRARACENRTSDHWPFEKAGFTVARVGGNDYPEYHSSRDTADSVDGSALDRVGQVMWAWLRA